MLNVKASVHVINESCKYTEWNMRWRYVLLFLTIAVLSAGCGRQNLSTDTRSRIFSTDTQKIEFLEKYATLSSPIIATEFHIIYHDNSTGFVPGPSDWDMKIALLLEPADIPQWLTGLEEVTDEDIDISWASEVLPSNSRWKRIRVPQYYHRPESAVEVAVYEQEGIVLKRMKSSK